VTEPHILSVEGLTRRYGGVVAVDGLTFKVRRGTITALIGPNGAGKTTTLNVISGITPRSGGRVFLSGEDATDLRADQICRRGMARTFQTPQVFRSLTVRENLVVATMRLGTTSIAAAAFRTARLRKEEEGFRRSADEWLDWVGLAHCADRPIGSLSFGQVRMAEVARVLASKPDIILMDEPASGLSRAETQTLRSVLLRIRDAAITVLLVEHNMPFVMSTAEHVVVLDKGRFLAEGDPAAIQADAAVRNAYLGRG
jgi:branched-chain amino acid transport system ATP-binding protein